MRLLGLRIGCVSSEIVCVFKPCSSLPEKPSHSPHFYSKLLHKLKLKDVVTFPTAIRQCLLMDRNNMFHTEFLIYHGRSWKDFTSHWIQIKSGS